MEDDGGLDLGLGLSCGGSSSKTKVPFAGASDSQTDEGDRGNKIVDEFKTFLHAGMPKQDSVVGAQLNDLAKCKDNFFNFSKASVDAEASINPNERGRWVANNNMAIELGEDKMSEASNKRKSFFDDMNHQKKVAQEANQAGSQDRAKTSHISITTDEGSTAENEDVAESEVDGSTSRLASNHEEGSKRSTGGGATSEFPKKNHYADSNVVESQGEKRSNIPSENEFKFGSTVYSAPYPLRPPNIMNMPYSLSVRESNNVGAPGISGYPMRGMIQMMPSANGDRPVNPGNLPLTFGYSPVQLPTLDREHSWGMMPHPHQVHPPYASRGTTGGVATNSENRNGLKTSQVAGQVPPHSSSEVSMYNGRGSEPAKGDGKQHATEEGASSQTEDDAKRNNINFKAKDSSAQPTPTEVFSRLGSAIRPGIAADLKFGGSGSNPNLPWVSTKGPGPNGRTISGVTYKFSANQIKIVCACHGSHMSPEEFVRHAGEENTNPETGNGSASFPNNNPAASAQS